MSATLDRWEAEARHDLEVFNQSGWGCDAKPLAEHVLALIAVARAAGDGLAQREEPLKTRARGAR